MSLRTRFILGFLSLALFLSGANLLLAYKNARFVERYEQSVDINFTETYHASRVSMLVQRVKSNLRELMLESAMGFNAHEVSYVKSVIQESLDELDNAADEWLQAVERDQDQMPVLPLHQHSEEHEHVQLDQMLNHLTQFTAQSRAFLANYSADKAQVAQQYQLFERLIERDSRQLQHQLESLWLMTKHEAEQESSWFVSQQRKNAYLEVIAAGLAMVIAVILGIWYALWITRSIGSLSEVVKRIETGDYTHRVALKGRDEVARLGSAINHLSATLSKSVRAQQHVEEELRDLNSELDAIIDHLPDMLFIKDAASLTFVRINGAGEQLLGKTQEELIGKSDFDLFPIEQAEWFVARDREVLESGEQVIAAQEPIDTPDGTRYLYTRKIVLRGSNGLPKYLLGISTDVTEERALREELNHLASHDPLTGIANRRVVEERLAMEFGRFQRYGTELSVMMVDADHFKQINDRYGHQTGDAVLRAIADQMTLSLRKSDLVGRFGGEEFLIVLPMTDLAQAAELAERLRSSIEAMRIPVAEQLDPLTVRISIGIADCRKESESWEVLVSEADDALYRAKQTGRNRVCLAAHLPTDKSPC